MAKTRTPHYHLEENQPCPPRCSARAPAVCPSLSRSVRVCPVWEAPGPGAALTWHLLSTCSCATLAMMNCRVVSALLPAVRGFLRQDSACRLSSLSSSLMNDH